MNKKLSYIFIGLFLTLVFFSSCDGKKTKGSRTDTPTSGKIEFFADESFSPFIEEERQQFEFEYPKAHLIARYADDITGFKKLQDLKTCLFFTSRALKAGEVAYFKSKNLIPSVFPIGYDGLAFIVNRNNTDTCITVNDIKRVLSGEVKKWSELYPKSKRGDIEVVFDNPASATLHYVIDSIMGGKNLTADNIVAAKSSKAVIDYVNKNINAIGIIGSNWLNDKRDSTNTTFKKNIHVMSVSIKEKATPMNSWKPYQAYLLDGRYPFARTLYAIVIDPYKALPWSFANYVTGPKGQLILFKTGLLPYRGDISIKTVHVKR
ncbi:PstS family phosphate ABC transporter substrate-binding protein [Segatella maculosa]|uniref:PBP domain-containing protein n=1 Tax=Segatella maculosa OT 289 TaxID=999422 RepID=H1HLL0_9BACT|nr:substrate-binding domain-containing protein [Segatella maculosa]EHO71938.1 hypothetical protein HMPREF9944_01054 [Segatella maculosa OT 289]